MGGGVMWGVMKCYVICQLHTALYDIDSGNIQFYFGEVSGRLKIDIKHRKNCECCPFHSLFKGHYE